MRVKGLVTTSIKTSFKNLLITFIIGLLLIGLFTAASIYLSSGATPFHIANTDLYLTCSENFTDSSKTIESINDTENLSNGQEIDIDLSKLALNDFEIKGKTTQQLVESAGNIMLYGKLPAIKLFVANPDDSLDTNIIPNYTYGISSIIVGGYPQDNQILIPEIVAQILLNSFDLNNYSDLVGQKYNLNYHDSKISLEISGVFSGEANLLINQATARSNDIMIKPSTANSQYIVFDSKSQERNYVKEQNLDSRCFLDSRANTLNTSLLLLVIYVVFYLVIMYTLLREDVKRDMAIINYYKSSVSNLLYYVPIILIYICNVMIAIKLIV